MSVEEVKMKLEGNVLSPGGDESVTIGLAHYLVGASYLEDRWNIHYGDQLPNLASGEGRPQGHELVEAICALGSFIRAGRVDELDAFETIEVHGLEGKWIWQPHVIAHYANGCFYSKKPSQIPVETLSVPATQDLFDLGSEYLAKHAGLDSWKAWAEFEPGKHPPTTFALGWLIQQGRQAELDATETIYAYVPIGTRLA